MMSENTPTPFGTGVQRFGEPGARLLRLDFLLLAATIGLLVFSVITLNGPIANDAESSTGLVNRQVAYAIAGLLLMLFVARIDYSRFREFKTGLYATMIGLILLVLAAGGATRGSRRWLELPFFRFQPSELGKLLLVVALAAYFGIKGKKALGKAGSSPD